MNAILIRMLLLCAVLCAEIQARGETIAVSQSKVVKLFGAGGFRNLHNYGSGCLVSADGYLITVWSHLLDNDVVTVVLADGRRFFGKLVAADSSRDLALLKIDAEGLPHFDLQDLGTAGPGTRVLAYSNVFKVATGDEPVSVMHGVVSSMTDLSAQRRFDVPYRGPVYLVDALTNNPGAAGGALTTWDGRLLGLLGRELRSNDTNTWVNYAVPLTELKPTILDMMAGTYTRPDPLASNASEQTGTTPADVGLILVPDVVVRTPAFVDSLIPDSPAAKAGLLPDDLVVFANGELVSSVQVLLEIVGRTPAGDDLTLIVRRENQLITVKLQVPRQE